MAYLFFDLFWTLIKPSFDEEYSENKIIGLEKDEWIKISENQLVSDERYLGKVGSEMEEVRRMTNLLSFSVSQEQIEKILEIRLQRIKKGLVNVDETILETLTELKNRGNKICIISNADLMDRHFWNQCPLKNIVDDAIFSCDVGIIKPDEKIYRDALNKMNANVNESFYIGDGGSNELFGAKSVGMKTVLAEHFVVKEKSLREKISKDADFIIDDFSNLLYLI